MFKSFSCKSIFLSISVLLVLLLGISLTAQADTLTMWTFNDDLASYYSDVGAEFAEEYGVNIEVEVFPMEQMHDNLLAAFSSGVGAPDLVTVANHQAGRYFNDEIKLVNLTERMEEAGMMEDIIIERNAPYRYNGDFYAIENGLAPAFLYYRADILDDYEIDVDDIETWDDFIAVGQELKKKGHYALRLSEGTGADVGADYGQLWVFIQLKGGNLFNEEGEIIVDNENNIDALTFYRDLIFEEEIAMASPSNFVEPTWHLPFTEGEVVFDIGADWYMGILQWLAPELEGKIEVTTLPYFEDRGIKGASFGGNGIAMTEFTDDKDLAWEFIKFARDPEFAGKYFEMTSEIMAHREAIYADVFQQPLDFLRGQKLQPVLADMIDEIPEYFAGPEWPRVLDLLVNDALYPVTTEQADPAEVLQAIGEELR